MTGPDSIKTSEDEIIEACRELYQTVGFKDITIRSISERTSLTRTSVYNYFSSKEEIFLCLLEREYRAWMADLRSIASEELDVDIFADRLAASLADRGIMLRLLSQNLSDMEENTRVHRLAEFKLTYCDSVLALSECVRKAAPDTSDVDLKGFTASFLPMLFGLHPYTVTSPKKMRAMELAGCSREPDTVQDLVSGTVRRLLQKYC